MPQLTLNGLKLTGKSRSNFGEKANTSMRNVMAQGGKEKLNVNENKDVKTIEHLRENEFIQQAERGDSGIGNQGEKSALTNELGENVVEISSPTDADKVFGKMNRMTSNLTKHSE